MLLSLPSIWSLKTHYLSLCSPVPLHSFLPYKCHMLSQLFTPVAQPLLGFVLRSVTQLCPTLCDPVAATQQVSLAIALSRSLLRFVSIESVMPSNHLILCHPLLDLPSIFPSIRALSSELVLCIRWPQHWSFSFSISPSNEYSGLISFRIGLLCSLAIECNFPGILLSSLRLSSGVTFLKNFPWLCTASILHPELISGTALRVQILYFYSYQFNNTQTKANIFFMQHAP